MARVLLTGAMGSVGDQLLPALEERYDVRLLDRAADGDRAAEPRTVIGELTDPDVLDRALDGVTAVVHLAGNPDPDAAWHELREPNVEGFVKLLAAAQRHGVRRVVFASSVHAMGAHEGSRRWPVDPAWPPAPCCAYGATKAFDEALARAYAYRTPMSLVGLRMGYCSPDATPEQKVAGWLGTPDLRQIFLRALVADVRFGVYGAVSWPSHARWDIGTAMRELGYEPERSEDAGEPDVDAAPLCTCTPEGWSPGGGSS
ncbi:MAG: NAD-dependent epimerase/dehydratase family protein [Actinomycetota bacterium]|nr:NAD-dependent epimerase/dehydratase family protein [Actinomycetota bacterium]